MRLILHGHWRSGSTWRTRIALNLKGLAYETREVDLAAGEQRRPDFAARNPAALVPWLEHGTFGLGQSLAIIDYVERAFPEAPRLVPEGSAAEAGRALEIANTIAADTQPLQNLRVLNRVREVARDPPRHAARAWGAWVVRAGLATVERLLRDAHGPTPRAFAVGECPSVADACIVPQALTASRYGVDVEAEFPRVAGLTARLSDLPAVADAHPDRHRPGEAPG